MKDIKLIGIDLDGTTLNRNKIISTENIKAFQKCKAMGIEIVPVTGRPYSGLYEEYKKQIGCKYSIHTNGAVVMDVENDKKLFHHPLKINTAKRIIDILEHYPCYFGIFYKSHGYLDKAQYDSKLAKYAGTPMHRYIKASRKATNNQKEFINSIDSCDNIYVIAENPQIRGEIYNAIADVQEIFYTCSEECDVEIGGDCSKGRTLMELAAHLNIKPSQVMAIGDSGNDLDMLRLAGLSVAMENSSEAILNASDYITKSCEESGVAHAINKFCLNR